jgi:hypothetical protein
MDPKADLIPDEHTFDPFLHGCTRIEADFWRVCIGLIPDTA